MFYKSGGVMFDKLSSQTSGNLHFHNLDEFSTHVQKLADSIKPKSGKWISTKDIEINKLGITKKDSTVLRFIKKLVRNITCRDFDNTQITNVMRAFVKLCDANQEFLKGSETAITNLLQNLETRISKGKNAQQNKEVFERSKQIIKNLAKKELTPADSLEKLMTRAKNSSEMINSILDFATQPDVEIHQIFIDKLKSDPSITHKIIEFKDKLSPEVLTKFEEMVSSDKTLIFSLLGFKDSKIKGWLAKTLDKSFDLKHWDGDEIVSAAGQSKRLDKVIQNKLTQHPLSNLRQLVQQSESFENYLYRAIEKNENVSQNVWNNLTTLHISSPEYQPYFTKFLDKFSSRIPREAKNLSLKQAFCQFNYPLISEWINNFKKTMPEQELDTIVLEKLLQYSSDNLAKIALNYNPNIFKNCPLSTFEKAVDDGNYWFVTQAVENGFKINDKAKADELIQKTQNFYSLPLIKNICRAAKDVTKVSYPDILQLPENEEERNEKFIKYATFSPLEDVLPLMNAKDLAQSPQMLKKVALFVRFPMKKYVKEMTKKDDIESYIKNTLEYADGNLQFVESNLPQIKNHTRVGLIKSIFESRLKASTLSEENKVPYSTFRISDLPRKVNHGTPIYHSNRDLRYQHCLHHLSDYLLKNPVNKTATLERKDSEILYYYTLPDQTRVELNKLLFKEGEENSGKWLHPAAKVILACQEKAEALHSELLDSTVDLTNPANKKEFFEKVAEGYWLIATLCETHRGTPHNSMVWLNMIYAHHGLPPPIPKLDHFFLDNTMIALPLDEVKANWNSYFEPDVSEVVDKKLLEEAAQLNPELAKWYSKKP